TAHRSGRSLPRALPLRRCHRALPVQGARRLRAGRVSIRGLGKRSRVREGRMSPRRSLALIAALLACGGALAAPAARAGRIAILRCHGPGGEALGHDGWETERTGDGGMAALDTCAAGGGGTMSLEVAGNSAGFPDSARIVWLFRAPPWATIVSYRVAIADSI